MQLTRILITAALSPALAVVLAVPAPAECPVPGMWSTTDGTMLAGRASEAWCGAGGEPVESGRPGNTDNAMSWDGASLGGQWHAWDMTIDADGSTASGSLDANGDGVLTYVTHYDGGRFWLSGAHAWSSGGGDLTGPIAGLAVVTTEIVESWVTVAMTSNVTFTGSFDACNSAHCSIDFAIADAAFVGAGGPVPADYPPFLCGATSGEWFDADHIELWISCAVSVEPATWGRIKSVYR